jgi:adenylate cyclase
MAQVSCLPDNQIVPINPGETILEALTTAEIPITHVCGGQAYCSTCRLMLLEGIENCTPPTNAEVALAKSLDFPFHVRLACQTKVTGGNVSVRRLILDQEDISIVDHQFVSKLSGNRKLVALLVARIRGTHDFDEVNFPYDVFYVMSRYFQSANQIISKHGGTTNSYLGTTLVATFGLENDANPQEFTERAVWAGLEMLKAVKGLNEFLSQLSYSPISLSLGIHTGPVVLVGMDMQNQQLVMPIGKAVNLASLIESANREGNTQLLVSESVYSQIQAKAVSERTGRLTTPDGELKIFAISSLEGEAPPFTAKNTGLAESSLLKRVAGFIDRFSGRKGKQR